MDGEFQKRRRTRVLIRKERERNGGMGRKREMRLNSIPRGSFYHLDWPLMYLVYDVTPIKSDGERRREREKEEGEIDRDGGREKEERKDREREGGYISRQLSLFAEET